MFGQLAPDRFVSAVEKASRHWEHCHSATGTTRPAFTIAISREAGARGAEVARVLGERLNWPVYDREILQTISEEMGLKPSLLESVDEKRKGWLQESLEAFMTASAVNASAYVRHLVEAILALGARGECVIVGRGAGQILPATTTLRVRLVAGLEDRIEAFRQRLGLPREEALRRLLETDRERCRFVKGHFHQDPADPKQYDLMLDSSRLSVAGCADLIVAALNLMQARVPSA